MPMINVSAKVQNKLMAKFSSTKADYIQSKFHVNMFLFHYLVPWVHLIKNHKTLKSYKKASFIILLPATPPQRSLGALEDGGDELDNTFLSFIRFKKEKQKNKVQTNKQTDRLSVTLI